MQHSVSGPKIYNGRGNKMRWDLGIILRLPAGTSPLGYMSELLKSIMYLCCEEGLCSCSLTITLLPMNLTAGSKTTQSSNNLGLAGLVLIICFHSKDLEWLRPSCHLVHFLIDRILTYHNIKTTALTTRRSTIHSLTPQNNPHKLLYWSLEMTLTLGQS